MTDWKKTAARMRGDLDRADIPGRVKRVAEFAVKATLMRGRTRVVIPDREGLCGLLGIGPGHIAGVFLTLSECRIVTCKAVADGWELLVFPDSAGWLVGWHYQREQMATYLALLDRAPGKVQGELIEPEPSLARAHAEVSAEAAGCSASSKKGNCGVREFPKRELSVNSNSSQLNGSKAVRCEPLTGAKEAELMDLLRGFVGVADVETWGGDWRKNYLRAHPRAFESALRTLLADEKEGWRPLRSKAAALKDLVRRFAGAEREMAR